MLCTENSLVAKKVVQPAALVGSCTGTQLTAKPFDWCLGYSFRRTSSIQRQASVIHSPEQILHMLGVRTFFLISRVNPQYTSFGCGMCTYSSLSYPTGCSAPTVCLAWFVDLFDRRRSSWSSWSSSIQCGHTHTHTHTLHT